MKADYLWQTPDGDTFGVHAINFLLSVVQIHFNYRHIPRCKNPYISITDSGIISEIHNLK